MQEYNEMHANTYSILFNVDNDYYDLTLIFINAHLHSPDLIIYF